MAEIKQKARAGEQKKGVKKRRVWLYIFIAAVLLLFSIIYVMPALTGVLEQTAIVEYGGIQVTDDATCYFIRDEAVYYASGKGDINYHFEEGVRVRKGTSILSVGGRTDAYVSDGNGFVSYYIDGNESYFTPENMGNLKKKQVDKLEINVRNLVEDSGASAASGDPLYKIVNGNTWYIVLWASSENMLNYKEGSTVTVELPMGDVKCSVAEVREDDNDAWRVILKTNRYYEELGRTRKVDARVITSSYEGLIVENRSIVVEDNHAGVYVKRINGSFSFTPVKVITTDGKYSVIEPNSFTEEDEEGNKEKVTTVKAYDEIRR